MLRGSSQVLQGHGAVFCAQMRKHGMRRDVTKSKVSRVLKSTEKGRIDSSEILSSCQRSTEVVVKCRDIGQRIGVLVAQGNGNSSSCADGCGGGPGWKGAMNNMPAQAT